MMSITNPSTLHQRLRQATKEPHHALDHHPILCALLKPDVSLIQYGNALAALHGIYAQTEAAILAYLQGHPDLFDYFSRRELPALEADLAALHRAPHPISQACASLDSIGALFGTLYTLEGATLGGQFIAGKLRLALPAHCPLQFYTVYGDQSRQRWNEFLHIADARCPPSDYETAAATAVALFETIGAHLDEANDA